MPSEEPLVRPFYLEPVATLDVDVFVLLAAGGKGSLLVLSPVYEYLLSRGHKAEGEYIVIGDWPVPALEVALLEGVRSGHQAYCHGSLRQKGQLRIGGSLR